MNSALLTLSQEPEVATAWLDQLSDADLQAYAPMLSPVIFAETIGLPPDDWQARVLRSQSPRILLNCSRQAGKSTITALLTVHTALYTPKSLALLLSPGFRQSRELFAKVLGVYRTAGRPVSAIAENVLSLELLNGSRIVCLPGKEQTIRGYSGVNLLVLDEAARVPDELYASVRPMLAVSGGRLIALSTPFGTRGWWYDAWMSPQPWERYEVPATQCPRIAPEFLDEERHALGDWWFEQEYLCRFLDAQSQAFTRAEVEAAFGEEVETWAL